MRDVFTEKNLKILLDEKVCTPWSRVVDTPLDVTIKWRDQQIFWKSTWTYKMDTFVMNNKVGGCPFLIFQVL